MPVVSAGLLLHRPGPNGPEVLIVHPGGPFWARRDHGAWSIPKGEVGAGEDPETAARREFLEELGTAFIGPLAWLGRVKQRGGKVVEAFAAEGDLDLSRFRSATFEMEWPPRSGRRASFPEVDRAEWVSLADARIRLIAAQAPLIDLLEARLR